MSWDEIWGSMIAVVAKRSTCLRGQVGAAVVTPENRVLAVGYNGAPRGLPHCMDVGCDLVNGHCIRTVHAELNAILNCDVRPKGCVLYTTTYPCYNCAKAIIQSGIREIRYGSDYDDVVPSSVVLDILMAANIYVAPIGV